MTADFTYHLSYNYIQNLKVYQYGECLTTCLHDTYLISYTGEVTDIISTSI